MFVGLTLSAWAVDLPKQGFGFHIGYAQPTLRLNSSKSLIAKDSLVNVTKLLGLKVGVTYDASYIAGFGSSMGINYTFATNNGDWTKTGLYDYPRTRTQAYYHELEIFVDWQYKFEVAKETYLILYTGPTVQVGLAYNTVKRTQLMEGADITKSKYDRMGKNEVVRPDEDLRRLNITWGVGAGFQYQRYFLRGGYDFGLFNPYKNQQFEGTDRYTRGRLDQWSVKIGMYLWYND